jgi:hypothetical protein
MHAAQVADELSEREQALRRLPLPFALPLRLRDAGIAADVICEYINFDQAALDGLYRIAEAKLRAAQKVTHCDTPSVTDPVDHITERVAVPGNAHRRDRRTSGPSDLS